MSFKSVFLLFLIFFCIKFIDIILDVHLEFVSKFAVINAPFVKSYSGGFEGKRKRRLKNHGVLVFKPLHAYLRPSDFHYRDSVRLLSRNQSINSGGGERKQIPNAINHCGRSLILADDSTVSMGYFYPFFYYFVAL